MSVERDLRGVIRRVPEPVSGRVEVRSEDLRGELSPYLVQVRDFDYDDLRNKPSIEGVELVGDKTFPELHLKPIDLIDIIGSLT